MSKMERLSNHLCLQNRVQGPFPTLTEREAASNTAAATLFMCDRDPCEDFGKSVRRSHSQCSVQSAKPRSFRSWGPSPPNFIGL